MLSTQLTRHNEQLTPPTYKKRVKWLELEALMRVERELLQHPQRRLVLFFPANTSFLQRPVMKHFRQKMNKSGRDLTTRHVYFRESHTWWTFLMTSGYLQLLEERIPTQLMARFTRRGGHAGDFSPPFHAPECTAAGDAVMDFFSKIRGIPVPPKIDRRSAVAAVVSGGDGGRSVRTSTAPTMQTSSSGTDTAAASKTSAAAGGERRV